MNNQKQCLIKECQNIYTMIVNFHNTAVNIQIRLKTDTRRDDF